MKQAILAALIGLLCTAAMAKDDVRQEQLRRLSPDRGDRRCASEGAGFIYVPDTGTCLRIGGVVGAQVGRETPNNLLGR